MRFLTLFLLTIAFLSPLHGKNNNGQPPVPKVVIYTIPGCFGCSLAKGMFEDREIPYEEINVSGNPTAYAQMFTKTGKKTVPQVFINDKHIGGYNDLSGSDLDILKEKGTLPDPQ